MLSVSSKDTAAATGILWASHPSSGDANHDVRPGTLEAYDARDVRKLLWSSDSGAITNNVGTFAKFNTPIVANGKVYEATFSNKLDVYGLYKTPLPPPVSVEQKENITGFSLSPNPAHESVRLTFFLSRVEKKLELKVLDLSGRQVLIYTMIGQLGANSVTLDIETRLLPGVYTITVQSDVGVEYTAKLAKY
jgi:hypothetical protein